MYYKGIDTPDREPTRNKVAEKERRSKFTEAVAKKAEHGDLYFAQRTRAHQRFYIEIEAGEHGVEETGLYCVTHKFEKPYPESKGRWEAYDGGGNIVIKVRRADDESISYGVYEAIEQALYRTPLGRVIGRDALRAQADSLCKAFGVERYSSDGPSTFTVDYEAEKVARDALRDLLTYAPETGYDKELGQIGAEHDGVGFAQDAEEYAKLLNGETDGFGKKYEGGRGPLPLLSQPVFYAVLGYKGFGRSFQARIDALMQAVGLDEEDI